MQKLDVKTVVQREGVALVPGDALLVMDMQNDFLPGGALAVTRGDTLIAPVNALMRRFQTYGNTVVMTQDWHPPDHASFASAHPGRVPFEAFSAPGIGPVLWPDHCVQGTLGAEFHRDMQTHPAHAIIRKGCKPGVDSYSGFVENDGTTETGLDGFLRSRGVGRVFVCGLAFDYCVSFTAADAADKGYAVGVVTDLTLPVGSPPEGVSTALATLLRKGVFFVEARALQAPG